MRSKLGTLCHETIRLLKEKKESFENIKSKILFTCPEFKKNLGACKSVDDMFIEVIRPEVSIIGFEHLEMLYELFELPDNSMKQYKEAVDSFEKKMLLEHAYGQLLLEELQSHVSKLESVTLGGKNQIFRSSENQKIRMINSKIQNGHKSTLVSVLLWPFWIFEFIILIF